MSVVLLKLFRQIKLLNFLALVVDLIRRNFFFVKVWKNEKFTAAQFFFVKSIHSKVL